MATYTVRNGRILAQVAIKPLPRTAKTFGTMEAAKIWAERKERDLRAIRDSGAEYQPPGTKMPKSTMDITQRPRIPAQGAFCGVYFLFHGDECVYVGHAVNVHARVPKHSLRSSAEFKEFDDYAWVPCPENDVCAWEQYYIKLLMPKHNSQCRPTFRERIAVQREANEIPHHVPKSLGSLDDLPESVQSIMGAVQKRQ